MEPVKSECLECAYFTGMGYKYYKCYKVGCPVFDARAAGTYQVPVATHIGRFVITRCNSNQEADVTGTHYLLTDGALTRFLIRSTWQWWIVSEVLAKCDREELLKIVLVG